jgi:methanogenic corrinoid protein MtbC1
VSRRGVRPSDVDEYLEAAYSGESDRARRITLQLLDQGVPFEEVVTDLLATAQVRVGEKWMRDEWSVADEHLVSAATQRSLDALASAGEIGRGTGHVVVACAEGDWHSLPAQMFAELLAHRGVGVSFLGASTPAEEMKHFLSRRKVDALVVSCTIPMHLQGASHLAAVARECGVPVLAGGRAIGTAQRALRVGADAYTSGIDEAQEILLRWIGGRLDDRRDDSTPPSGPSPLDASAPRIAEETFHALQRTSSVTATLEDLDQVVRFLSAARHADDPAVFLDFVTWLRTVKISRGVSPAVLDAGLSAMVPLVARSDERAAELAEQGRALLR